MKSGKKTVVCSLGFMKETQMSTRTSGWLRKFASWRGTSVSAINSIRKARVVVWLFFVMPLAACSNEVQWKEEVLLSDGKMIVIDRGVTFGPRNHELGQSATGAVKYWLSFVNPTTGQMVNWENPGKLKPMILAISDGVPYVVAIPISAYGYIEAGCPNPAYLFFRYVNGWESTRFAELPLNVRKRNLLLVYFPEELAPIERGFVSSARVAANRGGFPQEQEVDPNWSAPSICGTRFQSR